MRREYRETFFRQIDLELRRVDLPRTYDAEHVRASHRHLFGDVYECAGEYRRVNLFKGMSNFADTTQIDRYLVDAARSVRATGWRSLDRDQFAQHAARTFTYVNVAHPFREGNGRTDKVFLQHVAELSPWQIDYSPAVSGVTPEIRNQASMLSHPDRFQHKPVPDSLVPVFRAMAQPRSTAGPRRTAPRPACRLHIDGRRQRPRGRRRPLRRGELGDHPVLPVHDQIRSDPDSAARWRRRRPGRVGGSSGVRTARTAPIRAWRTW